MMIGGDLSRRLMAEAAVLPPEFSRIDPAGARLCQVYTDALARFCLVSLALAPEQAGPVFGAGPWRIGAVLQGEVLRRSFGADGMVAETSLRAGAVETALPGGGVQYVNRRDAPALLFLMFGGDFVADQPTISFANDADTPAFDIFSIQTRIAD